MVRCPRNTAWSSTGAPVICISLVVDDKLKITKSAKRLGVMLDDEVCWVAS